jgi:hypothetical protein
MTGYNASLLVIPGRISSKFEDLGGEVLQDRSEIDYDRAGKPVSVERMCRQCA